MASQIIGITGKKRSGKDTLGAALIRDHGYTRLSFADPLREMLKALNPVVGVYVNDGRIDDIRVTDVLGPDDDWEVAKEVAEVRQLLQRIGTEAGRDVLGDTVWVDALARRAAEIPGPVVITDVRFPNEADWIEAVGGRLVRVTRPGLVSLDAHPSETALDERPAAVTVVNSRTIEDLQSAANVLAGY